MESEQTAPESTPTPPPAKTKSDFFSFFGKIALLVIIAAALVGGGAYFGMNMSKDTNQAQSSITPTTIPTQTQTEIQTQASPTAVLKNMETFISKKMPDLAFASYSLSYPKDWVRDEKSDLLTQEVTFTKQGYQIRIWQGPTGGNACVFEGSMPDGPANDYRNKEFVEIKAPAGIFRRVGENTAFSFCMESKTDKGFFFLPTNVGGIDYKVPANAQEEMINEMDKIIATLETN